MKKIVFMLACVSALSAIACGDSSGGGSGGGSESKCDKAKTALKGCPDEKANGGGFTDACDADDQAIAQCILDFPDGACDHKDPEGDAFGDCVFNAL